MNCTNITTKTAHHNWSAELEEENPAINSTSEHKSLTRTPEILKNILELYISDKKYNISDENMWRTLIEKLQKSLNGTTEGEVNFSEENKMKPKPAIPPFITDSDELQSIITALNNTENVQPQQYLKRLQELATELVTKSTYLTNEEREQMLDR